MNTSAILSAGLVLAALSGCAPLQNVSASDVRKPEYAYRSETLSMTVAQTRQAVFEYGRNCRSLGRIDYDPTGYGRMYIMFEGMGMSKASIYTVIDFQGTPDGQTEVKSYVQMSTWKSWIDDVLSAIKAPNVCI